MKTHNLRPHLLAAQKENADKLAQNREVGKSLNIPTFSVRDDDHSIFRAMTTEKILQSVPSLAKRYEDPEFAALAQNDAENLGTIAKAQETPYDAMMREVRQTNEAKKQDSYSDEVISAFGRGWEKFKHNDKLQYAVRYEERLALLAMLPSERMERRKQEYLSNFPTPEMAGNEVREFDERIAKLQAKEATAAFQAKWQKQQKKHIEQLNKEQYAAVEQYINYVKQNNVNTNTYETNQALKVWDEDVEGFWQGTAWVFSNPKAALTAAAESTGYGAVPLVGTAVATMATGGVGGAVTAAVTNANNEFDASREDYYLKALQKRGLELTPENLLSLIRDTQTRREIEKKAGIRAATIGVGSAISLGVASKITSPLLAAGRPVAAASSGMAVGAVEGGSSEALAQLLTEGKVDGKEVAMEALLEIPGSAVELTSLALRQSYTYTKDKLEKNVAQQQQVDAAVQQSELREKAPDLFHEIVEETVENSENEHIYIEGEALNQSGLAEQVITALPEYQTALQEAIATGGSVQISRTDYLTKISPDAQLANELSSMMRFDEKGFSLNELAVQMEQETLDKARAEIEQAVTKQQESEQSSNAVRDLVLEQLATVNQFTPEVNQQMATLTASFYDAMASRLGTDAQSLYKRHKLTISDKPVADKKYHQLIGEQGSRALDATEEHANRLNGLQAARSMETTGKDTKTIRLATNWERGADGKWRYEIDDSQATVLSKEALLKMANESPYKAVEVPIDNIIQYDALFNAYPALREISVYFDGDTTDGGYKGGTFDPDDNVIYFGAGIDPKSIKSLLLHELQHGVQREEGFASGGSMNTIAQAKQAVENIERALRKVDVSYGFADWLGKNIEVVDEVGGSTSKLRQRFMQTLSPLDAQKYSNEIVKAEHAINKAYKKAGITQEQKDLDNYETYKSLSGEVEARNVENRMEMSEEERRNTLIRDTEDVAREDQIFLRDGGRADSASPMKSTQANIKRGREAMNKALTEKTSVHRAMYRNDTGWIDFVWGDVGKIKSSGKTKGGKGLSHIIESRMRKDAMTYSDATEMLTERVVDTLAKGQVTNSFELNNSQRIDIENNDNRVSLIKNKGSNSWVITSFDLFENKGVGGENKIGSVDTSNSTQSKPTLTRQGLGAPTTTNNTSLNESLTQDKSSDDNILHQSAQTPRGQYHPDSKTISLLENADLSTFQHELGHFFLESMVEFGTELRQQAQDGETLSTEQQQVINDLDTAMSWLGTDADWWLTADLEQRREKHEQFAKGFEAYLMEGKSPSLELQPLFERMRNWFISVYKQLKNLGVELNDDVRQVYGRLLASDEAITLAEQSRGLKALFETAEDAGMDSETFRQYQEHGRQASVDAMNYMHERVARDSSYFSNLKKHATNKLTQEARAARSLMKSEAEAAIMQRPVYRLWDIVSSKPQEGKLTAKLDKKSLLDLGFTAEQIKPLGRKVRASKGGVHPDVLADMLLDENGEKLYQSGAAMVDDLMSAKPPKEAIAELTDNLMLMRFGELYNEESLAKAADIAVHNDIRLRVLTRESNALAKATGGTQLLRSTARQVANETMGRKRVRDIRPGQFTRQEAAASKRADAAFKRGDTAIAAKEKRHQVLQSHLAKAAYEAQAEVLKHLRYFNRISKVNPQKINIEYRRQIESILERIDFRKRSLKSVDKSTNLRDWVEAQREQGLEPDIDERLLDESYRQSYHNMTLNELRGMVDSIKQIEHLGRLKNQLLTAKKQKDLEKAKLEIVANIEKNQYKTVNNRAAATAGEKVGDWLKSHAALHMKIPMIARIMDGNKDGGVMWEYIIRPANEKANYESTKRAEAAEKLTEILSPLFKAKDLNTRKIKSQIVDKNGQRFFTRQEVFAVALNMGNEGNLQRLLDGNGWTLAQVENLVSNLSTNELNAVQAAWDYMGSFRDEVAAKEIRVYGKEPDWVEAKPLKLLSADGDIVHLSGGYYPIKYDAGQNGRAAQYAEADEAKRLIQGAFTSATTRRSFTKNRSEKVIDRPLLLSLAGVYDGVNEVIHDLAWHEWLIDTNKLMRSSRVDAAIRTHHGKETNEAIKVWIEDIAAGDHRSRGSAYKFAAALRRNVSISALGLNFMSALKQPLGLTQTAVRVGYAEMIGSLFNYMANPSRMTKEAKAASEMMRNRSRTRFRDINEVRNTLNSPTWKQKTHQKVVANAYVPMMFVQQIVDVITWHAEYGKHIGKGDEARAVALADQAVIDSQGGGEIKDLSGIERHEVYHFFTPFYSFMNTAYNMVVATGRSPAAAGKKVADLFMLISAPALLDVLLSDLLKPGEDDELWWEKLLKGQISYIMGLTIFTKELSPAVNGLLGLDNFGWQGLPGTRAFKDASDFAKQAGQLEFDDAFLRTGINLLGITLGIPAVQINKTIKGAEALSDGDTDNPAALLMGYQK